MLSYRCGDRDADEDRGEHPGSQAVRPEIGSAERAVLSPAMPPPRVAGTAARLRSRPRSPGQAGGIRSQFCRPGWFRARGCRTS